MREIRSLTALRGVAAFYVALLHFSAAAQSDCSATIPALAPRGQLAVDFFFDLSGFVMAYSYSAAFAERGLRAMPGFLGKRVARIMPLHAAVILLMVLYTLIVAPGFSGTPLPAITSAHPVRDILANLFLLHGLGLAPNFNGPSWSISTEFVAYLAFPALLAVALARSRLLAAAAVAVPVFALWAICHREPHLNLGLLGPRMALIRCFAGFTLGLVAFRWYQAGWARRVLGSDKVLLALFGAVAAIMLFRLGDLFAALLFPFIILGSAYSRGRVARWLETGPLYFLGVISYSIYLIHSILAHLGIQVTRMIHPEPLSAAEALAWAALGPFLVILPAWLAYRAIERPGRDAVRHLLRRARAIVAQPAPTPAVPVQAVAPAE